MANKGSTSINLGLASVPDVEDPDLYAGLVPIYNAIRNVAYGLDAYTGNSLVTETDYEDVPAYGQLMLQKQAVFYVEVNASITAGQILNIYDKGGNIPGARLAQSGVTRGHAFALVSGSAGNKIPVSLFGLCTAIGSLVVGTEYYLSAATPGAITNAVTAQRVGIAIGGRELWFTP